MNIVFSYKKEWKYGKWLSEAEKFDRISVNNKEVSNNSMRSKNLIKEDVQNELLCVDATWREDPLQAELKSIWFGLDNVRKKGKMNFSVMSDCQVAVNILCKKTRVPWRLIGLVNLIWKLGMKCKLLRKTAAGHTSPKLKRYLRTPYFSCAIGGPKIYHGALISVQQKQQQLGPLTGTCAGRAWSRNMF
ncbi:hypothetical protein Cni_G16315 [Canna indica]|uniref:Uncharacterized protein n=1 Tax=Canna indica TaxID=4628 RepID=A0AAQ3KKU0_9LILI|nr:hypothetical protein Cni_G16315 [Canna indica]